MKKLGILILITGVLFFSSCQKFLDKTPQAIVSEKEVFGTYDSFQGFFDANYSEVLNYNQCYTSCTMDIGGETHTYISWASPYVFNNGDYIYGSLNTSVSFWRNTYSLNIGGYLSGKQYGGLWGGSWRGIRRCNLTLKNINLLSEATDEQKQFLLGQAYFFRAWFHQQIIESYGGMPYVTKVFEPTDQLNLPRLTYQAITDSIVKDYDKAIALLPADWDQTVTGSKFPDGNTGRATKGAAMAFKAKALLYAASPLMNKFSGNDYSYNTEYAKRAAQAGWDFISWNNSSHEYSLTPWSNYSDMFYKNDGSIPWTDETIFQRIKREMGSNVYTNWVCNKYVPGSLKTAGGATHTVNQTYIDRFEYADGTRYKPEYDQDNSKRWVNRDPRFYKAILVDRDKWGSDSRCVIKLYEGAGSDKSVAGQCALPYLIKKYWLPTANRYDANYTSYRINDPLMRLAEVYLDYAEAVTAAYGAAGSVPGSNFTAVNAINEVRTRCGMPIVTAAATGYPSFMELVWNERDVELCFEGHFWFDTRRWHVAHLPEYKAIVDLKFDKNWTPSSFSRSLFMTRIFEDPKHYWLPIPQDMTFLYKEMFQNPGWE